MSEQLKEKIMKELAKIKDPELGFSIIDLGYINAVEVKNGKASIKMVLTTPLCPYGSLLFEMVEKAVKRIKGVESVSVEYDWNHPWSIEKVHPEIRKRLGL